MKDCGFPLLSLSSWTFPGRMLMKSTASQCSLPEYDWPVVENGSQEGRAASVLQLIQSYTQHLLQVTVHCEPAPRADAVLQCKLEGSMSEMTKLAWR